MNRTAGNQEMIVFFCRNLIYVFLRVKHRLTPLCPTQLLYHLLTVRSVPDTQIDNSVFLRIQQIITFVLCVEHPEILMYKLSCGMYLQAQIPSAHCVQEVETDRKLLPEPCLNRLAQQLLTFQQNQIHRRQFKTNSVHFKIKTVFFRYTIKTPSVIRHVRIQVADRLHPLSAPRSLVKIRNHTERL